MCGIAGSLGWNKNSDRVSHVESMIEAMRYRGPDFGHVQSISSHVVFGHRRLAIIDLDPRSHQPMRDETGQFHIVFNGEIYNFHELRSQLMAHGHAFKTQGDTEVILEGYKKWGTDIFAKMTGMFAIAIWDDVQKRLILARDRMGEKPLFYTSFSDHILFASELGALTAHPEFSKHRQLSSKAMSQYLSLGYILSDTCMYEAVSKLEPGTFIVFDQSGQMIAHQEYWSLKEAFHHKFDHITLKEAEEELARLLKATIKNQMISDVPLGAFLSGGIDSSTVVAQMKEVAGVDRVNTYSIGFNEKSYNELPFSKQVAEHLNIKHHAQFVEPNMAQELPKMLRHFGEPFSDTSLIPTYYLSQITREHVTVSLSGDGGDELFLGYETYQADQFYQAMQYIPSFFRKLMYKSVHHLMPSSRGKVTLDYKLKQFLKGCEFDFPRAHYFWRVIMDDALKSTLLGHSNFEDPFTTFDRFYKDVPNAHYLDQASYVDMKTWLVDDILVKVDRMAMAHSLEVRVPFLDHHIVEFAAKLPVDLKWRKNCGKFLLKKSQEHYLPRNIIYRKKRGFNSPVSWWLSNSLKEMSEQVLLKGELTKHLDAKTIQRIWQEHQSEKQDHGFKLFSLLCLGLWLEEEKGLYKK